ncbi:N-acetylmuramoyl-L-alanine amidase family protein [Virgibacillus salexigens]|uniref:Sporulation-specific N-acetylmuramoyl-L-alanine amidase n=1 Tax=Virgibacillus massiliensis TaxID=1462526 RepID=A0A024QG60_9BACI|nr:N-acetylmuramoyl-L-alanine amidase [Virgibacillus massiliensis]CDQ41518.1 Sporulation-specific N-acetylmuramoyl-L-alanine amidase [Virgibacillus massiliensis]
MTFKLYNDPGHGGSDPGAADNGIKEKDIVLKISKKITDILLNEYQDVQVKMSRTSDTYPTLTERTNEANAWGADLFLSVHNNAGGGIGYEDYIHESLSSGSRTAKIQDDIHGEIMKVNGMRDRGQKKANFHVLRESDMPAVLTENGFIDNKGDSDKMKSQAWINDVARGHVNGIVKAFGLKAKSNGGGSKPSKDTYTVKSGDTLWDIANDHDMTVKQLKDLNNLSSDTIHPGQVLKVSGSGSGSKTKYVEVLASSLWVYNKPDWNAKDRTVKKGNVFTIKRTLTVSGSKMHQLKSGLYITDNPKYVRVYEK